jgi:hypothetical protein
MSPALSATSTTPAVDSTSAPTLDPPPLPAITNTPATPTIDPNLNPHASNISVREYIYFLPHPLPPGTKIPYSIYLPHSNPQNFPVTALFEPTRTIVLASPRSTFVDLRFLKPTALGQGSMLEWGFAGSSTSTQLSENGGGARSHSVWHHWVDSRVEVGKEAAVDEGDMYPINEEMTLEYGWAFHPALRRVSGHEEMWRDVEVRGTPVGTLGIEGKAASSGKGNGKAPTSATPEYPKICIVLRHTSPISRGLIIRVGQYIQGILIKEKEVTAERWEWTETDGWKKTERVGQQFVPCGFAMEREGEGMLGVGGKVTYKDWVWAVEESWKW